MLDQQPHGRHALGGRADGLEASQRSVLHALVEAVVPQHELFRVGYSLRAGRPARDLLDRLREQSEGWPGKLNEVALEAIKRSDGFPISIVDTYAPGEVPADSSAQIPVLGKREAVSRMPPKLIITRDGDTLDECTFKENKILVGRSDFADVIIDDDYVSKIHAILLLYSDALVLLDLNSANGTTVNSVKVRKTILKDDDVISLGRHRIKIENAPAIGPDMEALLKAPDTIKMKNLVDLRRQRARRRMMKSTHRKG